jgi:hypothetical protein
MPKDMKEVRRGETYKERKEIRQLNNGLKRKVKEMCVGHKSERKAAVTKVIWEMQTETW